MTVVEETLISKSTSFVGISLLVSKITLIVFQSRTGLRAVLHGVIVNESNKQLLLSVQSTKKDLVYVCHAINAWLESRLQME